MRKRIIVTSSVCVAVILCSILGYLCVPIEKRILWEFFGEYKVTRNVAYTLPFVLQSSPLKEESEGVYYRYSKDTFSDTYPSSTAYTANDIIFNKNTVTSTVKINRYTVHILNSDYLNSNSNDATKFLMKRPLVIRADTVDGHKGYIIEIEQAVCCEDIPRHYGYFIAIDDEIYAILGTTVVQLERCRLLNRKELP